VSLAATAAGPVAPPPRAARWAEASLPWTGVAAAALLWELSARLRHSPFFPPLTAALGTVARMIRDGSLPSHVAVSAFRGLSGFAVAITLGVPAGLWLGHRAPRLHAAAEPLLRVASQVNPFALMSVFLLVFGGGEVVKVMAVGWVALWPILFCTVSGAAAVDPQLVKAARSLAASPAAVTWRVVLPAAAPAVFAGLRLATGLVFFVLVAAEMLGATRGVGWLVHSSAMNYQVAGIFAGALAVVGLGLGLQRAVRAAEDRLFPRQAADADATAVRILDLRDVRPRAALAAALVALAVAGAGWAETRRVLAHDRAVMTDPAAAPAEPSPGAGPR